MKIGFPHLGSAWVVLETAFRKVGVETVLPPPSNNRSLSLGVKHSPEHICIPFKLTLGNMIESLEMGADTIIMAAGRGLCRFGYYARIQEQILKDLGFDFTMVTTDLFGGKIIGVARLIKGLAGDAPLLTVIGAVRLGLAKLSALDEVERVVHRIRALEQERGTATRVFKEAIAGIAEVDDMKTLKRVTQEYINTLEALPRVPGAQPLKIGLIGEFYVVLEPFSNMDVEIELGKRGVEIRRSIFLSEWTKFSLFLNAFGLTEKEKLHRAAHPYLARDVGGDGWETVGHKVLDAGEMDGLIHLTPFTCSPETVALNIMPSIKTGVPMLTIICDENLAKAGMLTRLDAFIDLLERRRKAGKVPRTAAVAY